MIESINWSNYSGKEFQLFCNILLSFEFGKGFRPFNAEGKDLGIDGLFNGAYHNKEGKWRFQYKFHKTARKQGADSLKADLRNEIAKLQDESHFVLVTNVELRPQEAAGLEESFSKLSGNKQSFEIWDGAKLFALSMQYPLILQWLDDNFNNSQLATYRDLFGNLLEAGLESAYTLGNKFAGHKDELEKLRVFFHSGDRAALVSGEGGIGKTRLVIEFFKSLEEAQPQVICLALATKQPDMAKIRRSLEGNKQYIILVDDAHDYQPAMIADLVALSRLSANIKLILTARAGGISNFMSQVKEYEQLKLYPVQPRELSRPETIALFDEELKGHPMHNFVNELAAISHGKPILIVSLLRAAFTNMPVAALKEDDFLKKYIEHYFGAFCEKVDASTDISWQKAWQLLQLICLIEPFKHADNAAVEKIAGILKADKQDIYFALDLLKQGHFVTGRYEDVIKPDYYSDIILRSAHPAFINECVVPLISFLPNMVINLSTADEITGNNSSLLDDMLGFYIGLLKVAENISFAAKVFDTILSICYIKPGAAQIAVNNYIDCLTDESSFIAKDFKEYEHYHLTSGDSILGKVCRMLEMLLYNRDRYEYVYDTIFKLRQLIKDPKPLLGVFHFMKLDFLDKFKLSRQRYFVQRLKRNFQKLSTPGLQFAIECLKGFMQHDFMSTTLDGGQRDTLSITTYFVPESPVVKEFRKSVIELLIAIFKATADQGIKKMILKDLLDIPRGILATKRNKTVYIGEDETAAILQFLQDESGNIPTGSQKEVLEKIHWYKRWGMDEKFSPALDAIKVLITPRNITEQLVQILAAPQLYVGDFKKAEEELIKQSRLLIGHNTAGDIAEALVNIFTENEHEFHYFHRFIMVLSGYPAEARAVYDLLVTLLKKLIFQFGAIFLQEQYYSFKEESYFRQKLAELTAMDDPEADNVILGVFSSRHPAYIPLAEKDIMEMERIFAKNNPANNFAFARALCLYVVHSPAKGTALGLQFLERCRDREADTFFLFLSDNLPGSYLQVKELCLQGSVKFDLAYNIEKCLNYVLKQEGPGPVFEYLLKRFEHKKNITITGKSLSNYEFVPDGQHSHLFDGAEALKEELYKKAIAWYMTAALEPLDYFYAKDLLSYLATATYLDEKLQVLFREALERNAGSRPALSRLLDLLAVFHHKDEQLLALVMDIYLAAYEHPDTDDAYKDEINYKAYDAITEVGVKSGTVGEPFGVDIDLKNLLEAFMAGLDEFSPFYGLLKKTLAGLDQTIQHSHDRDNDSW